MCVACNERSQSKIFNTQNMLNKNSFRQQENCDKILEGNVWDRLYSTIIVFFFLLKSFRR